MAKISGTLIVSSAPWLSKPSRLSNQPHWKIATRTPKAAPIESRFISTAFSGSSSERSITIRTRKLSARTKRTIFHIEPLIWARTSWLRAVSPPTSTSATGSARWPGRRSSRSRSTRAIAASDSLGALGVAWIRTLSPAKAGGATALTPGVASSVRAKPATAARSARARRRRRRRRRSAPGRCRRRAAWRRVRCRPARRCPWGTGSSACGPGLDREQRDRQGQQHRGDADHRGPGTGHHPARPAHPEGLAVGRARRGGGRPPSSLGDDPARQDAVAEHRDQRRQQRRRGQDRDRDHGHRPQRHRAQRLVVDHPEAGEGDDHGEAGEGDRQARGGERLGPRRVLVATALRAPRGSGRG